jgi:hypothetical protein
MEEGLDDHAAHAGRGGDRGEDQDADEVQSQEGEDRPA